jgi:hypothetical protein
MSELPPIEELAQPSPPPPEWLEGLEITVSQLDFMILRSSREDHRRLTRALKENGSLTVIPDP